MRIYVGNLAAETGSAQLRALFEPHGAVQRARLAKDKETGALRGFAIVEMEDEPAGKAIAALHGVVAAGKTLRVKRAKPRPEKTAPNGSNGTAPGLVTENPQAESDPGPTPAGRVIGS